MDVIMLLPALHHTHRRLRWPSAWSPVPACVLGLHISEPGAGQALCGTGVLAAGRRHRHPRATTASPTWWREMAPPGVGASLCAVVVFGLFISAPETRHALRDPAAAVAGDHRTGVLDGAPRIKPARRNARTTWFMSQGDRGSRLTVLAMSSLSWRPFHFSGTRIHEHPYHGTSEHRPVHVAAQFSLKAGMSAPGVRRPWASPFPWAR